MWIYILVLAFLASFGDCKFPSYVKVCRRDEVDMGACIKDAVAKIRPHLAKGIPEMNIPPFEPFTIPELVVHQNESQFRLKLQVNNIVAKGGSHFEIKYLKVSLKDMNGHCGILLPKIYFTAEYDIENSSTFIPIKGSGTIKGNITDIKVDAVGQGFWADKKGSDRYLQMDSVTCRIRIGDLKFTVNNPRYTPELKQAIELFYHDNRKEIINMILPIIENTANKMIMNNFNSILENYTEDEILLR